MCLPERKTDRRGRPFAFFRIACRLRRMRRANSLFSLVAIVCRFSPKIGKQTARDPPTGNRRLFLFAFLAHDIFAAVAHTLALVRFGRAERAHFAAELPDHGLVRTLDLDRYIALDRNTDAVRDRIVDIVAVAELQIEGLALYGGAIARRPGYPDCR